MLPVESIVAQLCENLTTHNVVLVAPPGAGKSTFLPLQLLNLPALANKKIIMLQPRRVAVRSIAYYLAAQLGEKVGETIGYRVRGESKVSANTRLEIVTEGLLTRKLQQDPELTNVGLVIFDEFHERSIHADVSLAMSVDVQSSLREDLMLLIMSATLDVEPLLRCLPKTKLLQSEGRSFPIEYHYEPLSSRQKVVDKVFATILHSLKNDEGSILVFLPGAWEIKRVLSELQALNLEHVDAVALYGSISKEDQAKAMAKPSDGTRKVVLATNIAETSLTIDGIGVVIDSGLEKVAEFHLKRGITQLHTRQISQASATQRAGRAGRLGPGICYRLWSKEIHSRLAKQSVPQILGSDISSLLLEVAKWGTDIDDLALLDKPSTAQIEQARELLIMLQACDSKGKLTSHGQQIATLGCHPRLGHMMVGANKFGEGAVLLACCITALLESNSGNNHGSVSIWTMLKRELNSTTLVTKAAKLWANRLNVKWNVNAILAAESMTPVLVALAFPDHISKAKSNNGFGLANGSGAKLDELDPLTGSNWLAIGQMLLTSHADARITAAQQITLKEIEQYFDYLITTEVSCSWKEKQQRLESFNKRLLGALEISAVRLKQPDAETLIPMWEELITNKGLSCLSLNDSCTKWLQKLSIAHQLFPSDWVKLDEQWLLANLSKWFSPYVGDITTIKQLQNKPWGDILVNLVDWQQRQTLDSLLPNKIKVPSGHYHAVHYLDDGRAKLSVKMQEMYGQSDGPSIAQNKVPLLIELLSPAGRPIQTTTDLAGFWSGSYHEVKKDMKGRYPKHYWPDDPANAPATTRTKKNM